MLHLLTDVIEVRCSFLYDLETLSWIAADCKIEIIVITASCHRLNFELRSSSAKSILCAGIMSKAITEAFLFVLNSHSHWRPMLGTHHYPELQGLPLQVQTMGTSMTMHLYKQHRLYLAALTTANGFVPSIRRLPVNFWKLNKKLYYTCIARQGKCACFQGLKANKNI